MINDEDVIYIGRITRSRGLVGEVEFEFTDDVFDSGTAEYFICDCEGIYVPFFWEEYRFKNDTTAIVKFEHIDNENQSRRLVGAKVYYPKAAIPSDIARTPTRWTHFTGYVVLDAARRMVGTVKEVDERSANILFTLEMPQGDEAIIPVHEDLIKDFDAKERVIVIDIPEGVLELNKSLT